MHLSRSLSESQKPSPISWAQFQHIPPATQLLRTVLSCTTTLNNKHTQRRENLFVFGLTLLCTLQQILCPSLVKVSTNIYYYIFIVIIEGQTQQRKQFLSLFLHFSASCIRKENKKEKQVAVLATAGNRQHFRSPSQGVNESGRCCVGDGGGSRWVLLLQSLWAPAHPCC